ncbi:hypothetical protein [Curtobacterium sp. MCPF17_031]|uniref:hypothetical protein n=1 Tax=Curtobacterium sp. MCPF17_031 TaxID=2175653 RepID=UPI000DAA43F6|nr:hypothetical protein [Curtobacterium sp. MCPF17_031]PZE39741.1 hypothetical protein DEJ31_02695 [Curtobacterium sp. MCPF17_031]
MSEALNANTRMQAIRSAARAKATAEVDRIIGRDRTGVDAAKAALDAANARVREARAHRDALTDGRRDPETGRFRRARGVSIDEWETAHDDAAAAAAVWSVASNRYTEAHAALRRQRPANLDTAVAAASEALDAHLDALPEAMTAAVEHLEAIRALSELAGRPVTSALGSDPIAAVDHLIPAIADAMRRAQRERAAFARDAVAHAEHVGPQVPQPAARGVDLDAINAQLAAHK